MPTAGTKRSGLRCRGTTAHLDAHLLLLYDWGAFGAFSGTARARVLEARGGQDGYHMPRSGVTRGALGRSPLKILYSAAEIDLTGTLEQLPRTWRELVVRRSTRLADRAVSVQQAHRVLAEFEHLRWDSPTTVAHPAGDQHAWEDSKTFRSPERHNVLIQRAALGRLLRGPACTPAGRLTESELRRVPGLSSHSQETVTLRSRRG